MSKTEKIERIKEVILNKEKPQSFMKIFIFRGKGNEPQGQKYYKTIPWQANADVTVPDEASAESLIKFLTKLQNEASTNPIITGMRIIKDE